MEVDDAVQPACPVCGAAFREAVECPRCGAALADLMKLVTAAWRLRRQARAALRAGDFDDAARLSRDALELHATPAGRDLVLLAEICGAGWRGWLPQPA